VTIQLELTASIYGQEPKEIGPEDFSGRVDANKKLISIRYLMNLLLFTVLTAVSFFVSSINFSRKMTLT
jgi:hypothetical protein